VIEHAAVAVETAPVATPTDPSASLLRDRSYLAVLASQGISAMGDAVTFIAMPLFVLVLTGSGVMMGIVGILETVPDFLFGLPAGALADRSDRRRILIATDLGRAFLTALIPLSVLLGLPTMTVILIVVGPINVLRVFFAAALNASVPALAGRDRLSAGSGYLEAVGGLAYVLGPAIAGILIGVVGPGPTLIIDAASFAASAVSLLFVRRSLVPLREGEGGRLGGEMADGIRFVWRHAVLRPAIGFVATFNLATAAFVPAFTFFVMRERGADAGQLGFMLSIWAIGTIVGALLATRTNSGRVGLRMLAGGGLFGICLALAGASSSSVVFGGLGFVVGATYSTVAVAYVSIRAANTPDALLGRVVSVARMATVGVQPLGMLAGGLLIDAIGGGPTLVAMGVTAGVAATLFAAARPLRTAVLQQAVLQPA
jgi:MFS transporter, ENTS family, enterobactin (siderophore) exporter